MARFRITPTTAAVIPVSGAVNFISLWVDSTNGPLMRVNRKDCKKVNQVTRLAATAPADEATELYQRCIVERAIEQHARLDVSAHRRLREILGSRPRSVCVARYETGNRK